MKVKIENLGVVKEAEVELGDLTVIAGGNSTGKTNVVYTIWDILRRPEEYLTYKPKEKQNEIINKMVDIIIDFCADAKSQTGTIPIYLKLSDVIDDINELEKNFKLNKSKSKKSLINIFRNKIADNFKLDITNIKSNLLQDSEPKYSFRQMNVYSDYATEVYFEIQTLTNKDTMHFEFKIQIPNTIMLLLALDEIDKENIKSNLSDLNLQWHKKEMATFIKEHCNKLLNVGQIEIATSDRAGIVSFLSDNQGIIAKYAQQNNKKTKLNNFKYLQPVNENIDFIRDVFIEFGTAERTGFTRFNIPRVKRGQIVSRNLENTHIKHIYNEIERMIGGSLYLDPVEELIKFKPFNAINGITALPFNNLSSAIKNMSVMYFQLKYSNKFSNLENGKCYYIIDEPEAFLHPENQMKMARIIAMMVNAGIKVIITTHSDSLVGELNGLITLGGLNLTDEQIENDPILRNRVRREQFLDSKRVRFYYMESTEGGEVVREAEMTPTGADMKSFDTAIYEQMKFRDRLIDLI